MLLYSSAYLAGLFSGPDIAVPRREVNTTPSSIESYRGYRGQALFLSKALVDVNDL